MDPHLRWSTLQLHLRTARAARDAGDRPKALESVEAALLIDPDFVAARMLRESLDAPRGEAPRVEITPAVTTPTDLTSTERYASFEARVRQRRIDQRTGAARTAIAARRFAEATAALEELNELDPALPASSQVAEELAAAVEAGRRRRLVLAVGVAWGVAGAALGVLIGRQPQWSWSAEALRADGVARAVPYLTSRALLPYYSEFVRIPSAVPQRIAGPESAPVAEAAPVEFPSIAGARSMPVTDDTTMIRETLQRYRRAYSGLDARLVHAVYPGVDEAALAHAFEELRSQSLEFDACTLDEQDDSARAVCRGSVRYVPAAGSGAPPAERRERRVWTFRLSKNNGEWTISSAWTNR